MFFFVQLYLFSSLHYCRKSEVWCEQLLVIRKLDFLNLWQRLLCRSFCLLLKIVKIYHRSYWSMQCEECAGKRRLVRIDIEQNAGHHTRVVGVCKVQKRGEVAFIYANTIEKSAIRHFSKHFFYRCSIICSLPVVCYGVLSYLPKWKTVLPHPHFLVGSSWIWLWNTNISTFLISLSL